MPCREPEGFLCWGCPYSSQGSSGPRGAEGGSSACPTPGEAAERHWLWPWAGSIGAENRHQPPGLMEAWEGGSRWGSALWLASAWVSFLELEPG